MRHLIQQLKWQLRLLHKNKIIGISIGVTIVCGLVLYFVNEYESIDKVLVVIVLNDPTIIGYFFVGLAVYTELKRQILPAIFTTPLPLHRYIISKTLALAVLGVICSLGLVFFVNGWDFNIWTFTVGVLGICVLSTLLGLIVLTFASVFLKFVMLSVPIFILFVTIPMLQYLGAIELGYAKYFFPIQGCVDLIDSSISGLDYNLWSAYISLICWVAIFYLSAFRLFQKKIILQRL